MDIAGGWPAGDAAVSSSLQAIESGRQRAAHGHRLRLLVQASVGERPEGRRERADGARKGQQDAEPAQPGYDAGPDGGWNTDGEVSPGNDAGEGQGHDDDRQAHRDPTDDARDAGQQPDQRDPAEPAPDQLERAAKGSDRTLSVEHD